MPQRPPDHTGLQRVRETALAGSGGSGGSGGSAPTPRGPVAASWRRVAACGLEPGSEPDVAPLGGAELERRRAASGLAAYVPRLTQTLASVIDAGQLVVVADPEGRVLWRAGSSGVRRAADDLGFVGGSSWTEGNVGTNAIGTCLVLGEGVHIQGPEHFVESHTRWGCAAAPIRDAWSGRTLGVVDVSGPSRGMHPAELALVELAARMTGLELARPAPQRARPAAGGRRARPGGRERRRAGRRPLRPPRRGRRVARARAGRAAAGPGRRPAVAPHPRRGGGRAAGRRLAAAARRRRPTATRPPGSGSTCARRPCSRSPRRAATGRAGSPRATPRSCWPWCRPARPGARRPTWPPTCSTTPAASSPCGPRSPGCGGCSAACVLSGPYRLSPGVEAVLALPADGSARAAGVQRPRRTPGPAARRAMSPRPRRGLPR